MPAATGEPDDLFAGALVGLPDFRGVGGYRGPCPPRDDARAHVFRLTLYALDEAREGGGGARRAYTDLAV